MPSYLSPGVYVEEVPAATRPIAGVGTAVAGFVGFAEKGPINVPTMITNWMQFTQTFGEFVGGYALAQAVYGYLNNGGGRAYVVRIPHPSQADAVGSGEEGGVGPVPTALVTTAGENPTPVYQVKALGAASDVSVKAERAAGEAGERGEFVLVVTAGDKPSETFQGTLAPRGRNALVTEVNAKSKLISLEALKVSNAELEVGLADHSVALQQPAATGGEIAPIEPAVVVGDVADRTGFAGFESVEDITMIAAPDLALAHQQGMIDSEGFQAVQTALINHCELMGNRMVILDPPAGLNAQAVAQWRQTVNYDSKFAVLYWPWVKVFDPGLGHNVELPPSGHVAGVWSRNDDTRGVFKAPANEIVRGALGVEVSATRGETDLLNPMGVNAIKPFAGRGIRVWGARTLASDAEWRYVNIRRYFNYLEESILQGTQWCVFEPNDHRLWGRIRRTISAFLVNEWRSGALFGTEASEAFFVKCDGENNTAESIDAGMVVIEIGVAPVKPAEFVIFRLSQFSGGVSIAE